MIHRFYFIFIVVLMLGFQEMLAQKDLSKVDSVGYSLGVMFAKSIQQQGFGEVDLNIVMLGLQEAMRDTATIDAQQAQQILASFIQSKKNKEKSVNLEAGNIFLADIAENQCVVVLECGLQYKILKEGTGKVSIAADKITVH